MKTLRYKITFLSGWHCGSGLSSGADLDSLVIKDKNKLPYIPGKTMKGLIREAVEEIQGFSNTSFELSKVFGLESNEKKECPPIQGCCFFSNAILDKGLYNTIINENLQAFMYRSVAQTAIDENGVAESHSLRKMEVTVPCELEGEILDVPDDDFFELMEKGLKFIKRLGQNRNRGLGRCYIQIMKGGDQ